MDNKQVIENKQKIYNKQHNNYKSDLITRFRIREYLNKIPSLKNNINTIETTIFIGRQSNINNEDTIKQFIGFLKFKFYGFDSSHEKEITKIIKKQYDNIAIIEYKKTKVTIVEKENLNNKITIYIPFWLRKYHKTDLEKLALRYASTYSSHLWNIPKYFYDFLYHSFNVNIEGFASPLNRFFPKYCSPFSEDCVFPGRISNFFDMNIKKLIDNSESKCVNIVAAPPFYNPICKKLVDKVIDDVNKYNCRYFMILPGWIYTDWYKKLNNYTSNNNCFFKLFGKGEVYYRNESISEYIYPPIATLFCVICGPHYPLDINDINNYEDVSKLLLKKNIPIIKKLKVGNVYNYEKFHTDKNFVFNDDGNKINFSFENNCNFFIDNDIYYAKRNHIYETNRKIVYKKRKTIIFLNGTILPKILL